MLGRQQATGFAGGAQIAIQRPDAECRWQQRAYESRPGLHDQCCKAISQELPCAGLQGFMIGRTGLARIDGSAQGPEFRCSEIEDHNQRNQQELDIKWIQMSAVNQIVQGQHVQHQ